MTNRRLCLFLCFILSALFMTALHGATTLTGTTDAGAHYQIIVPDNWNGDLVIFNRGWSGYANPPGLGPLKDLQLFEGYAVAATSFRHARGAWFKARQDLLNLMGIFKENFSQPDRILFYGVSMGAAITTAAAEQANVGNLVGALPICGALAGTKAIGDSLVDFRLAYDAVCSEIPGAYVPGGAEGLPADSPPTWPQVVGALHACTGILLPPFARTPTQADNLARILDEFQIPENFLLPDMFFATIGLSDMVHNPGKLNGKIGWTNLGVSYNDPLIDATIERVVANPGARNRLDKHYTPTGEVDDIKIISINTDKDGLVWIEHVSVYAGLVPAANLTSAVVVEDVASHCAFTEAELVAAWEELRSWVEGGPQPTADEIQATCVGLAMGPCRIDPGFVLPDPDGRLRRR